MADDKKKILIDVYLEASKAIKEITSLTDNVSKLKSEQKKLDLSTQSGREAFESYAAEIRENNTLIRQRRKEIDNNIKVANAEKGSLDAMKATLSNLKAEYNALSKADRESANGMAMRDTIKATNDALKIAEQGYGDFYRSVGQYKDMNVSLAKEISTLNKKLEEAANQFLALSDAEKQAAQGQDLIKNMNAIQEQIDETKESVEEFKNAQVSANSNLTSLISGNNQFVASLLNTASANETAAGTFKSLGTQASGLGKQLLALMTNPVVLIIAAIVGVLALLSKAFQRNEDNMTKLNVVMGKLSGIFGRLLAAIEPIAVFLVDVLIVAIEQLIEHYNRMFKVVEWGIRHLSKTLENTSVVLRKLGLDGLADKIYGIKDATDSAANAVSDFADEFKGAAEAGGKLVEMEAQLVKEQRESTRIQKEYQRDAERLRQLRDDDTKSISQRIEYNKQLGAILQKQLNEELRIAKLALITAEERAKIYGSTAENLNAISDAQARIADIEERITGKQSEQLKNEISLRKQGADKAFDIEQKKLDNKKAFDEAAIKSEKDYQKDDFNSKQAYSKRLFDLNYASEKNKLDLQRRFGKITKDDHSSQLATLELQQKEFSNSQVKELQDYFKEQRKELMSMLDLDIDQQIKELEERYKKALDKFSMKEPIKQDSQSDEDFKAEYDQYKNFMLEKATLELELEKQKAKDIEELRENSVQNRISKIEKDLEKQYRDDLAKFGDNEREKTNIEIKQIEERIRRKEEQGLSTIQDEADLRAAKTQANAIALDIELIQAGENAKQQYEIKKKYLEAEKELYKDNADKQIQLDKQIADNAKEYFDKRIALFEHWTSTTTSVLSSFNDVVKNGEQGELEQYEENNKQKKEMLDDRLKNGEITQIEYDRAIKKSEEELEKKRADIARKQAIREKLMKVFEIGVNIASGISKAVAASPLTFGLPFSAFVAATGVTQLAAVASQPLPKAARGGLIVGKPHSQGGTIIEAEKGEAIMTKRSVKMFAPLLSMINEIGGGVPFAKPMSDGGFAIRTTSKQTNLSEGDLLKAMKLTIKDLKIYTTVEDIRKGEKTFTQMEDINKY